MIDHNTSIYVAGHKGLVGQALVRALKEKGFHNLITRTHDELDLTNQSAVVNFFSENRPQIVYLAAAKVGGIWANEHYPADFIQQNLLIQNNVISCAKDFGVKRLLFLGSSCIYPRDCPQPIKEEYLLTGPLESTNRPYAIAKIAGIEMCWAMNRQFGTQFLAVMPTNLYGPGDNYDLHTSHVIPALIRKMHEAKINQMPKMTVWGTGRPKREFLLSDELARACVFLMNLSDEKYHSLTHSKENPPIINIGSGNDLTIKELAEIISEIVGFKGEMTFDDSQPDGTPRKILCIEKLKSFNYQIEANLPAGIQIAYDDYLESFT